MDYLFTHYAEKMRTMDRKPSTVFAQLYSMDKTLLYSWLENQFKTKNVKSDSLSALYRKEGNVFYKKKNLVKSLELYSKSLRFATSKSQEYGLALANRSAVFFEMREFRHCIKDIDLCFTTEYPVELKPKIYIRKAESYRQMNEKELLVEFVSDVFSVLEDESFTGKENLLVKLKETLKFENCFSSHQSIDQNVYQLPQFADTESIRLASASNKLKLSYNEEFGRHIIANLPVRRGDVLFVERAFSFAPVFKDTKELHSNKCYHCLKDLLSSVPCAECTICAYCDEDCRVSSWETCHRWECWGMQGNIWFHLGIALPGFKVFLKGALSAFSTSPNNIQEDLQHFGNKQDNYKYFSRLLFTFHDHIKVVSYVLTAALVVVYLEKYTDFFAWLIVQPRCPTRQDGDELIKYCGGVLTQHIAQLACNSSIIEHWNWTESLLPDVLSPVACGIFPTVSLMNHSCRPNVTNFFICDTIIVKALKDIHPGEEILNCYGIDYREMAKNERQSALKDLYDFECKCHICADPSKELDLLNSYLCLKCKGSVPEMEDSWSACRNCGEKYNLNSFRTTNKEAQKHLDCESPNRLKMLLRSLKLKEKVLHKHHNEFEEVYHDLYNYYINKGDVANVFKYFELWQENVEARRGPSCRGVGRTLYEAGLEILQCLAESQEKRLDLKLFLEKVEGMIREGMVTLSLYYPFYVVNKLKKNLQELGLKELL